MKKTNLVGIDVSSKELVVKIEKDGILQTAIPCFDNTHQGHKKLARFITKQGHKARVCMEATGIYHLELALYLTRDDHIDVMVVNPKVMKHFVLALAQRAKTDKVDAEAILSYLKCMEFEAWQAPDESCLHLQYLSRRMAQLKAEMTRETNRRHAGEYNTVMDNIINNDIAVNLRHIERRIDLLREKAVEIINSHPVLKESFDLLISIKGIATTSALKILSELVCLPKDMTVKQWVAYAGLNPVAVESGKSISKSRRISKAGNKYLRTALFMPAWVAVQSEPPVTAFYEKLIKAGKKPLQAIVAVMRKLLHAIWGMLKTNTSWDASKFYKEVSTAC